MVLVVRLVLVEKGQWWWSWWLKSAIDIFVGAGVCSGFGGDRAGKSWSRGSSRSCGWWWWWSKRFVFVVVVLFVPGLVVMVVWSVMVAVVMGVIMINLYERGNIKIKKNRGGQQKRAPAHVSSRDNDGGGLLQ